MRLRATLAADLVDALLSAQLALVVLATNREPLGVDGEHVLRLAPLPRPAAAELFLERLGAPAFDESSASMNEIAAPGSTAWSRSPPRSAPMPRSTGSAG